MNFIFIVLIFTIIERKMTTTTMVAATENETASTVDDQPLSLPSGYVLRQLSIDDFDHGFIELLEQLTSVMPISRAQFQQRFEHLDAQKPRAYHIFVIEEESSKRIVATATLVLEWKFIHSCGARGRIEDVVVDGAKRGKHLGQILNQHLVLLARQFGVYKLSLECTDSLVGFYEKFGFRRDGNQFLVQRF